MKPMLACDWDVDKVKFPVIVQPKIDGVRGLNFNGQLVGRSLKQHKNANVSALFSGPEFIGLDGELIRGTDACASDLCRKTTSLLNTFLKIDSVVWIVFDYITPETIDLPYHKRFEILNRISLPNVQVVPSIVCPDMDKLITLDRMIVDRGFEGTILRDPNGRYKEGRSTVKEGGLLRIKRFEDAEAKVINVTEGNHNGNESQTNELGLTYRTSHKENMVPNGLVGNLICETDAGEIITVSPGKLTESERRYYFENQSEIVGKIIKYKHFPKGVKDKPRFPTFQGFRLESDL